MRYSLEVASARGSAGSHPRRSRAALGRCQNDNVGLAEADSRSVCRDLVVAFAECHSGSLRSNTSLSASTVPATTSCAATHASTKVTVIRAVEWLVQHVRLFRPATPKEHVSHP